MATDLFCRSHQRPRTPYVGPPGTAVDLWSVDVLDNHAVNGGGVSVGSYCQLHTHGGVVGAPRGVVPDAARPGCPPQHIDGLGTFVGNVTVANPGTISTTVGEEVGLSVNTAELWRSWVLLTP